MKSLRVFSLLVFGSLALFGQKLEFEVATVRPSATSSQDRVDVGVHMDGSQVRISSFTLRDYIALAYRVKAYQISGSDWVGTDRFDVNSKLPAGAKSDQIPAMMQVLLADRFQLKFHRDKKDASVYAITVGKPPLKLKEVASSEPDEDGPAVNVAASGSGAGVSVDLGHGSSYTFSNNKFDAKKMNMDVLATMLERYVDRPIVNLTELKGNYDVVLEVTPEDYQAMLIRAAVNSGMVLPPQVIRLVENNAAASLMDAAQRVGLKIDARKVPLDLLVVDQALKTPTDN